MSPLPLWTLSLSLSLSLSLFCYPLLSSVSVFPPCCAPLPCWYLPLILLPVFLFLIFHPFLPSLISHSQTSHPLVPPPTVPKVISTGKPSMRIQCWRLRGAGSWSSSLSSLSPKASSHLKVSATSEVRSQAPTKGVIYFLSIHVCDWLVSVRDRVCEIVSVLQWLLQ